MKGKTVLAALVISLLCAAALCADEGMWTFDNPPRSLWKERYGFEPRIHGWSMCGWPPCA
jgi:hypothetical protein